MRDTVFFIVLAAFLFIVGLIVFQFVDAVSGDSKKSHGTVIDKIYIPGHYEESKNILTGKKENNYIAPEYSITVWDVEFDLITIDVSAENYKRIDIGYTVGYDLMIGGISKDCVGAAFLEILEKSD